MQAMVDAAIAEAKAQLAKITIDYEETTVPHGFDPTDSSSGSVSVPSNGSATAVVANQPWQAHVTWEKRDALTGGRITEDAEYVFYEWNVDANEYEISSNYRVTRLENGLYTVTVTNPVYTDWTEGYVYYTQDNLGKFRIEEVTAPAGYTDAALQGTDWVEHWSQEFEITASDQTYSYTGDDADYNRPQGNKVIIKKIEAHTGEIIVDDAVFTLYQWNEERGLYEKSKDYAFVRDTEGLYTITCLGFSLQLCNRVVLGGLGGSVGLLLCVVRSFFAAQCGGAGFCYFVMKRPSGRGRAVHCGYDLRVANGPGAAADRAAGRIGGQLEDGIPNIVCL